MPATTRSPAAGDGAKEDDGPSPEMFLAAKPLLVVHQLLGCLPLSLKNHRLTPCLSPTALKQDRSLLLVAVYTVAVYLFITFGVSLRNLMTVIDMNYDHVTQSTSLVIQSVLCHAFFFTFLLDFTVPARFWLYSRRLESYFRKWQALELEYARVSSSTLAPLSRRKVVWGIVAAVGLSLLTCEPWRSRETQPSFGLVVSNCTLLTSNLLWQCFCEALRNSAGQLLQDVEEFVGRTGSRRPEPRGSEHVGTHDQHRRFPLRGASHDLPGPPTPREDSVQGTERPRLAQLDDFSNVWRQLSDILGDTGNVLFFNFILQVVVNSVRLVILVYHASVIATTNQEVIRDLILLFFYSLILFAFLNGAHEATAKVNEDFKRRLLLMYVEEKNESCKEQLLRFIQVISAGSASISLGEFLTCDRSLLTALFNAVLTYLVVLLQLQGQLSRPPATTGSNATQLAANHSGADG